MTKNLMIVGAMILFVALIAGCLSEPAPEIRYKAIIILLAKTGMRVNGLAALDVGDIDIGKKELTLKAIDVCTRIDREDLRRSYLAHVPRLGV